MPNARKAATTTVCHSAQGQRSIKVMSDSRNNSNKLFKSERKVVAMSESPSPSPASLADDAGKNASASRAESGVTSSVGANAGGSEGWTGEAAPPPSPASLFDGIAAAQQRYVLNSCSPGRRLAPVASVAPSDPPPPWYDASSEQHALQWGHLPFVVDELVCLPSTEEGPDGFNWRLLTKIAMFMVFYACIILCAYQSVMVGIQDWCAVRNLVLILGLLLTVLPFMNDTCFEILDGYPEIREKLELLATASCNAESSATCYGRERKFGRISLRRLSRSMVVWYVSAVALLEWKAMAPLVTCFGSLMLAAIQAASCSLESVFGDSVDSVNLTEVLPSTSFADLRVADIQAPFLFRILSRFFMVTFWINFAYCISPLRTAIVNLVRLFRFVTGATMTETTCALANMFLPMVYDPFLRAESTIMLQPYLPAMTPSELFTAITCGFATLSASVLPELVQAGIELNGVVTSGILGSLGSLCISKIYLPEVDKVKVKRGHFSTNKTQQLWLVEVLGGGMMTSLVLAGCMMGCLIAFITFHAFADGIISCVGDAAGVDGLGVDNGKRSRAQDVAAALFRPYACVFGLPWDHTEVVARVMALKALLHEPAAAAYLVNQMSRFGRRARTVAMMSMCCSPSIVSCGVLLAVLQLLSPRRTKELGGLVAPAMVNAFTVNVINGCLACMSETNSLMARDVIVPEITTENN
ncbi:hypothetical protein HPB50_010083 [Hyalomma asiaticum]|uniref:Uncharacterized protein n=1 Tax=Hyalomma asiaticum TaxID=266040 RepID=A0ACB7THW7_HYAAI|nr:hypothetical protein HPB50_010083 [Hyalomma asiaticum]